MIMEIKIMITTEKSIISLSHDNHHYHYVMIMVMIINDIKMTLTKPQSLIFQITGSWSKQVPVCLMPGCPVSWTKHFLSSPSLILFASSPPLLTYTDFFTMTHSLVFSNVLVNVFSSFSSLLNTRPTNLCLLEKEAKT